MGNYRRPHHRKPKPDLAADSTSPESTTNPNPSDPSTRQPSRRHNNQNRGRRPRPDSGIAGLPEELTKSAPAMKGGGVDVKVIEEVDERGVRHVVDGVFYRFTDIVYEWHPLLNPWQCNALKSLISSEALVCNDHPLYTKASSVKIDEVEKLEKTSKFPPGSEIPEGVKGGKTEASPAAEPNPATHNNTAATNPADAFLPGLHLHLALFPSKKVRLLFTLKQIDYLRYYITALDLVKCTKEDVKRWKDVVKEKKARVRREEKRERKKQQELNKAGRIGVEVEAEYVDEAKKVNEKVKIGKEVSAAPTEAVEIVLSNENKTGAASEKLESASVAEDEEEEGDDDVDPRYIPLPSSKSLVFPSDIEDMVVVRFTTVDQLKLAYRNPLKVYKSIKAGTFYDDLPGAVVTKEEPPVAVVKPEADMSEGSDKENVEDTTKKTVILDEDGKVKRVIEEKIKGKGYEGIELGPSSKRPPGPSTTYHHAEQAYIVASQGGLPPTYVPGHEPSVSPYPTAGRGVFLTIDFEPWSMELGVILEVGWAACWFDQEKGGSFGNWTEDRDQGHWIVKDHIKYRDTDLLAGPRPDYYYGDSESISLEELRSRVATLIDNVRAKCDGGPVYLVTHSAHKTLLSYGLIDLPTEGFRVQMHPEGFVSPAYQTAKGNGQVFVIDTSEMIAALTNGINDNPVVDQHDMSLEDMTNIICRQAPEPIEGFGHSGNDAWIHLECFLAMVQWNFDIMFSYFNQASPDEPLSAAAAQEAADRELAEAKMWQEAIEEEEGGIPDFDAAVKALNG